MQSGGGPPSQGDERSKDAAEATGDIGEVIGGYRLEIAIGAGGMGRVFRAKHVRLNRPAAVKIIRARFAEDKEMLLRFDREAKIVSDIRHPNIVEVFDLIEIENPKRVACIMEYLEGPSLKGLLSKQRLTPTQAINLTLQLTDATRAVHQVGVVHRDIKPANVMVIGNVETDLSAVPSVKLLDFGIAKVDGDDLNLTRTGAMLGTPRYMSPEQIGGGALSSKADIYALGELLYEMICGRPCFPGEAVLVFRNKLSGKPPDLRMPAIVPAGDQILSLVHQCILGDPAARPTSDELTAELKECLRQVLTEDPEGQTRAHFEGEEDGDLAESQRRRRAEDSVSRAGDSSGSRNQSPSSSDSAVARSSRGPSAPSPSQSARAPRPVATPLHPVPSASAPSVPRSVSTPLSEDIGPDLMPGNHPNRSSNNTGSSGVEPGRSANSTGSSARSANSTGSSARSANSTGRSVNGTGRRDPNASGRILPDDSLAVALLPKLETPGPLVERTPAREMAPRAPASERAAPESRISTSSTASGRTEGGSLASMIKASSTYNGVLPPGVRPAAPPIGGGAVRASNALSASALNDLGLEGSSTTHGSSFPKPAPQRRKLPVVLVGSALVVLGCGAALFFRGAQIKEAVLASLPSQLNPVEAPQAKTVAPTNPTLALVAEWEKRVGKSTGSTASFLAEARAHYLADRSKDYAKAEELLAKALVLSPNDVAALGFYVENLAAWKGRSLEDDELLFGRRAVDFLEFTAPQDAGVARARGALALVQHDVAGALRALSPLLDKHRDDALAHLLVAEACVEGDPDRAIQEAETAVSLQPQLRRRDLVVARAFANSGHYNAAFKTIRERVKKEPPSAEAQKLLADFDRELGRTEQARSEYRQAAGLPGDQRAPRIAEGEIDLQLGNWAAAEEAFRSVAKDKESNASYRLRALIGQGRAAFAGGHPDRVNAPVDEALHLDAHDLAARLLRAEMQFQSGDPKSAETLVKELLLASPGEPAVLVLQGRIALSRSAGDDAVRCASEALQSNPHDSQLRAVLAGFYLSFGAVQQAASIIQEAAKLDPLEHLDDPRHVYLGVAPTAVAEAIARLQKATGEPDTRADAVELLGMLDFEQGRLPAATARFDQALHWNGASTLGLVYASQLALLRGDVRLAEGAIGKLLQKDQHSGIGHLLRARLYSKKSMSFDAKAERNIALRVDPSLFLASVELAAAAVQAGESDKAKALFLLLKERPNVPLVRRTLFEAGY